MEKHDLGMGLSAISPSKRARSLVEGARLVQYAVEQGIGLLDAAESYQCYLYMRKALRDLAPSFSQNALPRPVIVSKSFAPDAGGMLRAIEECRSALELDQIDIFMLQDVGQALDFENRRAAWGCLQDAKAKGLIKAAGISTRCTDTALAAAKTPGMDYIFSRINFKGLGIGAGGAAGEREDMESAILCAAENGVDVYATGVLGGGELINDYSEALGYASDIKGAAGAIIGMGCKQDVDDAVAFIEGRLPPGYNPATSIMRMFVDHSLCIRCGECVRYCTDSAFSFGDDGFPFADPEKCVRCGFCLLACPSRALLFL